MVFFPFPFPVTSFLSLFWSNTSVSFSFFRHLYLFGFFLVDRISLTWAMNCIKASSASKGSIFFIGQKMLHWPPPHLTCVLLVAKEVKINLAMCGGQIGSLEEVCLVAGIGLTSSLELMSCEYHLSKQGHHNCLHLISLDMLVY